MCGFYVYHFIWFPQTFKSMPIKTLNGTLTLKIRVDFIGVTLD